MRSTSRTHDRIVSKYRFPTDELLKPLGISCCEIMRICAETPLRISFKKYGCDSRKEPDIIYELEDYYLVGEIKSRNTYNNYLKAKKQSLMYSSILNKCDIRNKPFVALGDSDPELIYQSIL